MIWVLTVLIWQSAPLYAQVPLKMSYQAVIRAADNQLATKKAIGMQISILQGSSSGTPVYTERHFPTTNENGFVSLEIGTGLLISGNFSGIDWSNGPYFLKTETDLNGGANYTIAGTSQLLSVPFAFLSDRVLHGFSGNYNDLTDTPDFSGWDKDQTDDVKLTGDQHISGNKTFTGSITVPTPVNSNDAVSKAYVDLLLARIEALEGKEKLMDTRDGHFYNFVKIGDQFWMTENLKYLPEVIGPGTISNVIPYYYVNDYDGTNANSAKFTYNYKNYGVLYNWPAAMAGSESSDNNPGVVRGICPEGCHLPSNSEWLEMIHFLGGTDVAGGKLKEDSFVHWNDPNYAATNESGFTGLPGGDLRESGVFDGIGTSGSYWTSTQTSDTGAWSQNLYYDQAIIFRFNVFKYRGFSVRCVKD